MRLTPRYGDSPVLLFGASPSEVLAATLRQRRRFAATLATLDDEQWAHPSRCAGWSSRDVVVHLESTNGFWALAIDAGRQGRPTEFLATFDPVASPAQMVAASGVSPSELTERFATSTEAFAALLESLSAEDWTALAEAPPGHIPVDAVVTHALWDSWVHERDVLLPLGLPVPEEADEVGLCLRYAAALGPALAKTRGDERTGVLAVAGTDPDVSFVVGIGADAVAVRSVSSDRADLTLTGPAVELTEALSMRRPLASAVPADQAWLLGGLAAQFDAQIDA